MQTQIAAYMSRYPTVPLTATDIAGGTGLTAGLVTATLARICAGEGRPYPVVREGRGKPLYRWVNDPSDVPACVAVLAEMIGYVTGADHDHAARLAGHVLELAKNDPMIP